MFSTDLVITDLGEGCASDAEQSLGRKYYGNIEFWAPEIRRSHVYTFASDVYAVGILIADMVKERWKAVLTRTGTADRSVPSCILEIINWCIHPEPKNRPSADSLYRHVQDLHSSLLTENAEGDYDMVFTEMKKVPDQYPTTESGTAEFQNTADIDEDGIPY